MVCIKTIDFPDGGCPAMLGRMDTNPYALEQLARERLADARLVARRLDLVAQARGPRRPLRGWVGAGLVALGEWLRGGPAVAAVGRA
jgi:hypothetical protein